MIKKYFTKSAIFSPCWCSCTDGFVDFLFFFHNGPHSRFIYLKTAATSVADLNFWCILSNLTFFFCNVMTFFLILWSTSNVSSGPSLGSPDVIQRLVYCTKHDEKYMKTARENFLFIFFRFCKSILSHPDWFKTVFALAAHTLKNWNDTEKISMAPEQGWHANSWSITYFSSDCQEGGGGRQ